MKPSTGRGYALAAVMAGALMFITPALINGYPIVFSDTGGFLEQALLPDEGWDKPWIYGPFLTPFHLRLTLWPAIYAQALLLSATLWLTRATIGRPSPVQHLVLCATLTLATAAPWFASLLMPDIFAPITVLGLFTLFAGRLNRLTLIAVGVMATLAIAVHLAHLVLAAACIAALALFDRRSLARTASPLTAALALLLLTNWVGHNRWAISPYGADFALARLVADGPARVTIQESCPTAGWRLCEWRDTLPDNADAFLWAPNGPVWANGYGPIRIAPEAAEIVRKTILSHPLPVLLAALRNTITQLGMVTVGDTLIPDHLKDTVAPNLLAFFPAAERDRFMASRQAEGTLPAVAAPLQPLHLATLALGTIATIALAALNPALRPLATLILIAVIANAISTGALSGPHDRYQARLAWLVIVTPLYSALPVCFAWARRSTLPAQPLQALTAAMPPAPLAPQPAADGSSAG